MRKEVKHEVKRTVNAVLAAVGLAMGIAAIVIPIVNAEVTTDGIVRMLAIATASLGILALNGISKSE